MTYENPRVKTIQNQAIERSNRPLNKYNEAMHRDTEAFTGIPGDRTGYDCGMEMEIKNNQQ